MNTEKNMSNFEIFESLLRKHGYENSFRAAEEYASQQNKELITENLTYISLLDDATKEISKRDKQIEELKAENERLKANRKEEIEQAHMSGQRNSTTSSELPNGIDPSYSEALNYYLTITPNNNEK